MLQEMTAETAAASWAIASMLFFLIVYVVVAVRAFRAAGTELDARARLPLDDGNEVNAISGASGL